MSELPCERCGQPYPVQPGAATSYTRSLQWEVDRVARALERGGEIHDYELRDLKYSLEKIQDILLRARRAA